MDIELRLDKSKLYRISDHLYGNFLEDIGFAVDGGLNANMVSNYSFLGRVTSGLHEISRRVYCRGATGDQRI